jgi:hypothetical protein
VGGGRKRRRRRALAGMLAAACVEFSALELTLKIQMYHQGFCANSPYLLSPSFVSTNLLNFKDWFRVS